MINIPRFKDLTGIRFGRLTVQNQGEYFISKNGGKKVGWVCICDCGNVVTKEHHSLLSGNTRSCGCLHKESARERGKLNKKYNTFDLSGEYGIGYTAKGEEFYFDLDDYGKIKNYYWYKCDTNYIEAFVNKVKIYQHRFIMNCPKEYEVDHISHTQYDNRKCNLRIVSHKHNLRNIKLHKDSTSGVTGVSYAKSKKKWRAYITYNQRQIFLGYFTDFNDAITARKEAEEKYFGEYSYDNSMIISSKYEFSNLEEKNKGGY